MTTKVDSPSLSTGSESRMTRTYPIPAARRVSRPDACGATDGDCGSHAGHGHTRGRATQRCAATAPHAQRARRTPKDIPNVSRVHTRRGRRGRALVSMLPVPGAPRLGGAAARPAAGEAPSPRARGDGVGDDARSRCTHAETSGARARLTSSCRREPRPHPGSARGSCRGSGRFSSSARRRGAHSPCSRRRRGRRG